ncbi:hypothetical protein L2E82_40595 [Cichorium intybus]|uniref:Uncharacterized protein n=1 Tax=Cichorium intybus TaxID=13427 RepID=A0ACB9AMR8_CICIN|nr:hypothetical protein L2E82_40595 [Cichorium intybus]
MAWIHIVNVAYIFNGKWIYGLMNLKMGSCFFTGVSTRPGLAQIGNKRKRTQGLGTKKFYKDSSDGRGIESALEFNDTDEMGFTITNNVDEKDENFGNLDKVEVSRIENDDDKKGESLSFSKMLDWLANAARNPHDVAIGSIPNSSRWKKFKSNEVWKQVLLVKDTLFAKRNVKTGNKVYGTQKKRHMMHPSMYEDDKIPVHLSSKRTHLQRVSSVKSCSCPGCKSCLYSPNKRQKPDIKETLNIPETVEIKDDVCKDLETEIVIIGAQVPEWTGVVSESDPKWLGTRMWPPRKGNTRKHKKDLVVIGKGRESRCRCSFPGSSDCVRFHISQNRKKVKHMLGPLFYKWKFNHMGEEASCSSWSLEEETEFKSLIIKARQELTDKRKSRHAIMNNFWRRASECIPSKTKDVLVSYYFNVFVLRRRSYQNRIMPDNIDSDDDEQEVGYEKIHELSIRCSKNTQGTNLES